MDFFTFPVRNTEYKFPKLHHSYCLEIYIVALYLADKCYRIYHKHVYSVKIMVGKKQESTALWNGPHEVSVVVTVWGFFIKPLHF